MGELDRAVTEYRRTVAIIENAEGKNHRMLVALLSGLGDALIQHGDAAAAIPVAQRAVDIAVKVGGEPMVAALARLNLGQALYESGRDRGQGRDLVREARKLLVAIGPGAKGQVEAVDGWLKARNIRP